MTRGSIASARNRDALLLSARELARVMIRPVRQAHTPQFFQRFCLRLLLRQLFDLCEADHDVIQRRKMVKEQEILKDHPNMLADLILVVAFCRDFFSIQEDLAAIVWGQQVDAAEQSAFARPAGTDDHDGLTLVDLEVDILKNDILTVNLGQVASLQNGIVHERLH
jgi:hypothetical protein